MSTILYSLTHTSNFFIEPSNSTYFKRKALLLDDLEHHLDILSGIIQNGIDLTDESKLKEFCCLLDESFESNYKQCETDIKLNGEESSFIASKDRLLARRSTKILLRKKKKAWSRALTIFLRDLLVGEQSEYISSKVAQIKSRFDQLLIMLDTIVKNLIGERRIYDLKVIHRKKSNIIFKTLDDVPDLTSKAYKAA